MDVKQRILQIDNGDVILSLARGRYANLFAREMEIVSS
jgi:hypothetical protein